MYAKLFTSIYQGTLRGNSHGLLVFTNLLAHADSAGVVDMHPKAIADEVGLTEADVRTALVMLEAPDEESRTPDMEGRRIVRTDEHRAWGWLIVNHAKYRAIRNEEDRREQNRLAQQRWREKNKPRVSTANGASAGSAHTEADTEADTEAHAIQPAGPSAPTAERASKPPRASRKAPKGLQVTPPMREWATKHAPGLDIEAETSKFTDHTFRNPISDWGGAWRNWMRRAFDDARTRRGGKPTMSTEERDREAMRLLGIHPPPPKGEFIDV